MKRCPEPTRCIYPGGYPELHAAQLARNHRWLDSMRAYSLRHKSRCSLNAAA